jgi:hypothetical protein
MGFEHNSMYIKLSNVSKLQRLELDEPAGEPGPRISSYGTLLVTSPTQVVLLKQLQVLNVTVQKAGLKLRPGPQVKQRKSVAGDAKKSLLKIKDTKF